MFFQLKIGKDQKTEVNFLFKLILRYFQKEINHLLSNNIKINIIGNLKKASKKNTINFKKTIRLTSKNKKIIVNLAINYGSKDEIVNAAKIAKKKLSINSINKNIYTKNIPDPDILIRTGGHKRLSNFMLWQLAYSEIYFLDKLWPDFNKKDLTGIIKNFKKSKKKFWINLMNKNFKNRVNTSIVLLILFYFMFISNFIFGYFLIIIGVLSILEFLQITKKAITKKKLLRFISNFIFIFYIFVFCSIIFLLFGFSHLKILLFLILASCIASDIGGYVFGKLLKGPKLTKISPNKTISGSVGSIFFSSSFLFFFSFFFTTGFQYKMLILAIITSVSCQIGDLLFSYFKRKAQIKDTANYLPGHGGVLDRIDGIMIGVPIGFLTVILIF